MIYEIPLIIIEQRVQEPGKWFGKLYFPNGDMMISRGLDTPEEVASGMVVEYIDKYNRRNSKLSAHLFVPREAYKRENQSAA